MKRYGSVCSGIEAATVAWHALGWTPAFFAEIDRFPSEVLAHHYGSNLPGEPLSRNAPPNLGDMTRFQEWPDAALDVLVGGTPCQSFSVAGLRKGLADPRGNLALTYLAILDRYRPEWMVWENVPGVLSSWSGDQPPGDLEEGQEWEAEETSDFGCFLAGLQQLGYGFAYRVLDAQYVRVDGFGRAVPQRRRRVFVVGNLGDWRRAAAVLLERESLSGNPPPRRRSPEDVAGTLAGGARSGGGYSADDIPHVSEAYGGNRTSGPIEVAAALNAHGGPAGRMDFESETFVATVAATLDASFGRLQGASGQDVRHGHSHLVAGTLTAGMGKGSSRMPSEQGALLPIAFDCKAGGDTGFAIGDVAGTLRDEGYGGGHAAVASGWAVRRLTPTECERLQGFPDGYTAIPRANGKPAADGARYKALGNSMACNVMRWIGRRIELVDALHPPSSLNVSD